MRCFSETKGATMQPKKGFKDRRMDNLDYMIVQVQRYLAVKYIRR